MNEVKETSIRMKGRIRVNKRSSLTDTHIFYFERSSLFLFSQPFRPVLILTIYAPLATTRCYDFPLLLYDANTVLLLVLT